MGDKRIERPREDPFWKAFSDLADKVWLFIFVVDSEKSDNLL